ncbi:uracil-DNA glycosylase isoform X2 [Pipistrellus kuhlii]|uniref:uracil-DNA glycosylase isoform X2 n=1 Tax=Pipistrellus kuhlii TaxID=59472 RepID=UPI001E274C6F|nr:uracil-DNA glycosylase isoform X2 [Pipistrellus kuhlii]
MIGQKTIYSFFSPSPAGKRRARSPEPAAPGTGVAAVGAEISPAKKARAEQEEPGTPPSSPLSPEQLDRIQKNKAAALLRLAARNVPVGFGESWKKHLSGEFGKPYFIKLMGFVAEERRRYTVYPPPHQVFTWTQMCNIRDVKVVILGQDPYHGPNQAHGLCFSVQRPVPPPPSLENIYKELSTDIEGFVHPGHGDLSGWAKQEAPPRAADRPPLPSVGVPRVLWVQTFLQNQRAAAEVRQGAHQLEGPVTLNWGGGSSGQLLEAAIEVSVMTKSD